MNYLSCMDSGRKNSRKINYLLESRLRLSSKFLNSELFRGSLTPTLCCSIRFRNSNIDKIYDIQTVGTPIKHQFSVNQCDSPNQHYAHLKDTLSQLQIKIKKAQQILAKPQKQRIQRSQPFFDYEETISEIESNITKKIDYTYNQVTQNSTKNLSFLKNSQSLDIPRHIDSFRNKNTYYIGNIYDLKDDKRIQEHLQFSFQTFRNFAKFRTVSYNDIEQRWILAQAPEHKDKKTILLDIDQTILHCEEDPIDKQEYDMELDIPLGEGENATAYISLRPYALTFLRNIAKNFQVIAFTASHQSYADVVLDELDPDHQIFSHRLYRGSCQQLTPSIYAKDIRIINRRPEQVILIDNSPYSYIFQLENGIPILPYRYGADKELPKLQKYLAQLNKCDDVRQMNKKTFSFHRYNQFNDLKQLIRNLYLNKY